MLDRFDLEQVNKFCVAAQISIDYYMELSKAISFLAFPRNKKIEDLTDQMLLIGSKKKLYRTYYKNDSRLDTVHLSGQIFNNNSQIESILSKTNIIFNRVFK